MSAITRKCLLNQIFSFSHLIKSKETISDLQDTSLYIPDPFNPSTTHLHHGKRRSSSWVASKWCGIITCHDYQSIEFIKKRIESSPKDSLTCLFGGFDTNVDILFILLDVENYIRRSVTVNMSWCRRMWSLSSRAHMIAVTGVYYSVLGGAYCSLGKSNTKYAYKAGALAIEQIKLAQRLKDPILECKCWLYFAEDLIQLGKLKKAEKIISRQVKFIELLQDSTLTSMLESVVLKMDIAVTQCKN